MAVVFWELDGLDGAARDAREQALTALGAVAWRTLRESDAVFRLGDVVAVGVLVDTAEPGALIVAERLRDALRTSAVGGSLTVSAGIAHPCSDRHTALGRAKNSSTSWSTTPAGRRRPRTNWR